MRLSDQVREEAGRGVLLPTPKASDGEKGGPNQRGSSGDYPLPAIAHLLPTPQAHDAQKGKTAEQVSAMRAKGHGVANLNELAENELSLLQTPSVADATGGHERRGGKRNELLLNGQVKALSGATTHRQSTDGSGPLDVQLLGQQNLLDAVVESA